jgi:hypothetical protein
VGQRLFAVAVVIASACTALHYSVTTQQMVAVNPSSYHFGAAGTQMFMVTPAQPVDDDSLLSVVLSSSCNSQWQLILDSNDSLPTRICGSGSSVMPLLADGVNVCPHSYAFQVSFTPMQPGMSFCNVLLNTEKFGGSGSDQAIVFLSGSGAAGSGITVTPMTIDFKEIQINTTSSSTSVVVKNNSTTSGTTVSMQLVGSGFTVMPNAGFSLGSSGSASFQVTCTPTLQQVYMGTLTFTSGSAHQVSLSCTGIDSTIFVMPTQVNFGSTLVGRAPAPRTVRVTSGNSAAVITAITLDQLAMDNGVSLQNPPINMSIGSGQDVILNWSAAAMHPSGPLGTLTLRFDTETAPRNVAITGEALLGGIGTSPASVEFGAVCAGGSATEDVEVYADEPADVNVMLLVPPAAPFSASASGLPKTLQGNHSGTSLNVSATFAPMMPGDIKDAFALETNIPGMGTTEIELHGIGIAAGMSAIPEMVHFGTIPLGTTTSIKEVQFTNCGTKDLNFTGATLIGDNAAEFALIGTNPSRLIKKTESEKFMIVMQPRSGGFKSARLLITHEEGSTFADLDGTGDGATDNKDRETYYACSTGRGGALWPLLIALLALRRRRR